MAQSCLHHDAIFHVILCNRVNFGLLGFHTDADFLRNGFNTRQMTLFHLDKAIQNYEGYFSQQYRV